MAQGVKNLPAMQETQETQVQSLGQENPLEEEMATHSSILAWTEEPGKLQSMGFMRFNHDSAAKPPPLTKCKRVIIIIHI